jgi:hypothetical protein
MSSNAPPSRRTPSSPSVTRGATARSAVNPRVSASLHSRRASIKSPTPPPHRPHSPDAHEVIAASLRRETEEKERVCRRPFTPFHISLKHSHSQLLVQLQNKDQTISSLSNENSSISTALHTAETQLYELYAEQARMDEELSARIEVTEKLRSQVRELEKEKRDVHRRYNEQVSTHPRFDARIRP